MAELIEIWHAEHATFSRLLDVLDEQVGELRDGQWPVFGLMLDIVSYMREFGDALHHPREDAAFARLVIREPALRLPINRLLQEHRAIAVAGEEFVNRLNEAIVGNLTTMHATVEAAAALYLTYFRHHLVTEEREILPRAASLLKPYDWSFVSNAVASIPDPLSGDAPDGHYHELRDYLAARKPVA